MSVSGVDDNYRSFTDDGFGLHDGFGSHGIYGEGGGVAHVEDVNALFSASEDGGEEEGEGGRDGPIQPEEGAREGARESAREGAREGARATDKSVGGGGRRGKSQSPVKVQVRDIESVLRGMRLIDIQSQHISKQLSDRDIQMPV